MHKCISVWMYRCTNASVHEYIALKSNRYLDCGNNKLGPEETIFLIDLQSFWSSCSDVNHMWKTAQSCFVWLCFYASSIPLFPWKMGCCLNEQRWMQHRALTLGVGLCCIATPVQNTAPPPKAVNEIYSNSIDRLMLREKRYQVTFGESSKSFYRN